MRDILEDSIQRVLADHVTPELLRACEGGDWPEALWRLIEDNGYTLALVGEAAGGSGLEWSDVYPLVVAAGQHSLPLPLPETMLAAWLLDQAGLDVPPGPITVADTTGSNGTTCSLRATWSGNGWHLNGELPLVPWGRFAPHVVLEVFLDGITHLALIDRAALDDATTSSVREDMNLAREPRDTFMLNHAPALAMAALPARLGTLPIRHYGAMLRSAQMAGAMERLVQQSIQYAGDRVQFGKPIGKFQAIQQQLAVLGCESAASAAGAAFAFEQAGSTNAGLVTEFAIATAKVRASEAAGLAASIAHATHGAIGFTYEHTLHFSTRRLWSWRSEFGHHGWWSARIGAAVCRSGAPFWDSVTTGRLLLLDNLSTTHRMETT
jgi:acyl-CoA dehydrogenase